MFFWHGKKSSFETITKFSTEEKKIQALYQILIQEDIKIQDWKQELRGIPGAWWKNTTSRSYSCKSLKKKNEDWNQWKF